MGSAQHIVISYPHPIGTSYGLNLRPAASLTLTLPKSKLFICTRGIASESLKIWIRDRAEDQEIPALMLQFHITQFLNHEALHNIFSQVGYLVFSS